MENFPVITKTSSKLTHDLGLSAAVHDLLREVLLYAFAPKGNLTVRIQEPKVLINELLAYRTLSHAEEFSNTYKRPYEDACGVFVIGYLTWVIIPHQ